MRMMPPCGARAEVRVQGFKKVDDDARDAALLPHCITVLGRME
jgi:hypothetical protein